MLSLFFLFQDIMSDEEQKEYCLVGLEECIYYTEDEIDLDYSYNIRNKDEIEELSWALFAYKELYSQLENSELPFYEDVIGCFQSDMLEYSRRNKNTSRMFMCMFNTISTFLEYIYVIIDSEIEYRKEKAC